MAPEYDSNPVLHVGISGVGSAPGVALEVGPAFWPLGNAKQKLAFMHKVRQQLYKILPACSRVLQATMICIERAPYSLLSTWRRQKLPPGMVTNPNYPN